MLLTFFSSLSFSLSPSPPIRYKRSKPSSASNSVRQMHNTRASHRIVQVSLYEFQFARYSGRTLIKVAIPGARRRFATTRYRARFKFIDCILPCSVVLVYRIRLYSFRDGSFSWMIHEALSLLDPKLLKKILEGYRSDGWRYIYIYIEHGISITRWKYFLFFFRCSRSRE